MAENNAQTGALQAVPFMHSAPEPFAGMARMMVQAAQSATEHMRALMGLSDIDNRGLQDIQRSLLGSFEGIWRTNVMATQELFHLRSSSEAIDWQQRYARAYLDALTGGSGTREQHAAA